MYGLMYVCSRAQFVVVMYLHAIEPNKKQKLVI